MLNQLLQALCLALISGVGLAGLTATFAALASATTETAEQTPTPPLAGIDPAGPIYDSRTALQALGAISCAIGLIAMKSTALSAKRAMHLLNYIERLIHNSTNRATFQKLIASIVKATDSSGNVAQSKTLELVRLGANRHARIDMKTLLGWREPTLNKGFA